MSSATVAANRRPLPRHPLSAATAELSRALALCCLQASVNCITSQPGRFLCNCSLAVHPGLLAIKTANAQLLWQTARQQTSRTRLLWNSPRNAGPFLRQFVTRPMRGKEQPSHARSFTRHSRDTIVVHPLGWQLEWAFCRPHCDTAYMADGPGGQTSRAQITTRKLPDPWERP